jgi:hypothetical protein
MVSNMYYSRYVAGGVAYRFVRCEILGHREQHGSADIQAHTDGAGNEQSSRLADWWCMLLWTRYDRP